MSGHILQRPRAGEGEKMQEMVEKVHMNLVQLQAQLKNAYGIEPTELNMAVSNTSKILQMAANQNNQPSYARTSEAPIMLPTPSDRPLLLTGRPKKLIHYQPLFKNADILALASDPESSEARKLLQEHWGIQLPVLVPLVNDEEPIAEKRKPVTGLVLAKIPVNKKAALNNQDVAVNNGLITATQQGAVPKTSKFIIRPQPIHAVNLEPLPREPTDPYDTKSPVKTAATSVNLVQAPPNTRQTIVTQGTNRDTGIPGPPPASPAPYTSRVTERRLAIQNGLTRLGPELDKLRERSESNWPMVRSVLDSLEILLQNYAIPLVFVAVEKIQPLAQQMNAGVAPNKAQLLELVVNRLEVEEMLNAPGRRFMGKNGTNAAVVLIQSWWRGVSERKRYQAWRASKLRTALVALHWLMNAKLARVRRLLQQSRADQLEAYRSRLAALATSWPRMKNRRRLVIHLPSFGLPQDVRNSMTSLVGRLEHAQLGRLCEIRDPLVDTIYISPIRLSPDDNQYLAKLLALLNAIKTGSSADAQPCDDRYAIVVPETIGRFPTHYFHNAASLKYSAKSLSRLRALTAGRDAYIVPWQVSWDDLAVAAELGLPLLGPEPDVARVYGCKSGAHRLLVAANVELPPGQADLHSAEQVSEALARLVAANTEYLVWLLKIDDERNGRGTAVIDMREFLPAKRLVRERARFGDEWFLGWSQEASAQKLQSELQGKHVLTNLIVPNCPWVYENGAAFLEALSKRGGLIEAAAPTGSTSVTVDILVEPDGNFQIVSTGDQFTLETQRYTRLGATMPQTSMDTISLNERCRRIAETCRDRGVVGYVSVDLCVLPQPPPSLQALQQFRTRSSSFGRKTPKEITGLSSFSGFTDDSLDKQEIVISNLWVTGLKLGYSLQLAMMQMLLFLTEGSYFPEKHRVEANLVPELSTRRRLVQPPPKPKQRYATYAYPLRHSGLKSVSRAVFFQLCRAHGIGFDVRERCGTAFLLNDASAREELCMLCVADNLPDAVSGTARNLKILNTELSSPKSSKPPSAEQQTAIKSIVVPTKLPAYMVDLPDNFVAVADELDHILHTVFANEQMQLEQEALKEAQMMQEMMEKKKLMSEKDIPSFVDESVSPEDVNTGEE